MGTFSLLGCSLGAKGREAQGVVGIWRAKAAGTTVWEVGGVMVWAGLPAWGGSQHSPLPQACLPHAESRIDSSIWKSTAPVKQWQLLPQGPGEKEAVPGARPLQTRRVPRSPWAGSRTVRTPQAQLPYPTPTPEPLTLDNLSLSPQPTNLVPTPGPLHTQALVSACLPHCFLINSYLKFGSRMPPGLS